MEEPLRVAVQGKGGVLWVKVLFLCYLLCFFHFLFLRMQTQQKHGFFFYFLYFLHPVVLLDSPTLTLVHHFRVVLIANIFAEVKEFLVTQLSAPVWIKTLGQKDLTSAL